jgi:hypothetical protein
MKLYGAEAYLNASLSSRLDDEWLILLAVPIFIDNDFRWAASRSGHYADETKLNGAAWIRIKVVRSETSQCDDYHNTRSTNLL